MLRGLVTALRTLTLLRVPGKDTDHFSQALYWFPAVGLLLGAIQAVAGYLILIVFGNEIAAAAVLFTGIIMTRGMHADGFADVADGFFGGGSVEARLRIMKDPAVGSFGVTALILLILFKWILLVELLAQDLYSWIVSGIMLARLVQVFLASTFPYARKEGGTASAFVKGAGISHVLLALSFSVAALLTVSNANLVFSGIALLISMMSSGIAGFMSMKKIRGVTGDVLGASSEITEVMVWGAGVFFAGQFIMQ